jgi:hypothetical protein
MSWIYLGLGINAHLFAQLDVLVAEHADVSRLRPIQDGLDYCEEQTKQKHLLDQAPEGWLAASRLTLTRGNSDGLEGTPMGLSRAKRANSCAWHVCQPVLGKAWTLREAKKC